MLTAIGMVRDEADIISYTLEHLLSHGVDRIIVADNLSVDGTREILEAYPVEVVDDHDPGYWQADKMTRLAGMVRSGWVLPFDADELFYPADGGTLGDWFADCTADVVVARGWDHIARADVVGNPWVEITERRKETQRFPKVAFRAHPDAVLEMGNHGVDRPGERVDGIMYRHSQYRSFDQYARKVRQGTKAYDATDLDKSYGAHWRRDAALDDESLSDKWREMCATTNLVEDPAPWLS